MTRLARRAALLVALYLLTSASTASAECAWAAMIPCHGNAPLSQCRR